MRPQSLGINTLLAAHFFLTYSVTVTLVQLHLSDQQPRLPTLGKVQLSRKVQDSVSLCQSVGDVATIARRMYGEEQSSPVVSRGIVKLYHEVADLQVSAKQAVGLNKNECKHTIP